MAFKLILVFKVTSYFGCSKLRLFKWSMIEELSDVTIIIIIVIIIIIIRAQGVWER